MRSTAVSDGISERTKNNKWSGFLGTVVALLTLTLPLISIACYSSFNNPAEALQDGPAISPNAD
jgi:hypothetical protein